MSDEQLKRQSSFDLYGRYRTISDIVESNRGSQQIFRILDVGGRGNQLKRFLPHDEVFYLEPEYESDDANFIRGDGCDIPLDEGSYDFVVSADVYEHIAADRRRDFLSENLRVARLAVILVAPFQSPATELAERFANENFQLLSGGQDHPWLKEHMDNGLPQESEIQEMARDRGHEFQRIPNNNLMLWETFISSAFLVSTFVDEEFEERSRELNFFYNQNIFPGDHTEDSYRKIYFIKKDPGLQDLQLSEAGIDSGLMLEALKLNFDLLFRLHLRLREKIEEQEKEKVAKDLLLGMKDEEIAEVWLEVERRQRVLEGIYASNSWKVTKPLRDLRSLKEKHTRGS